MKNSDYWKKRFEILEAMKNQNAGAVNAEIEMQFKKAQQTLTDQINAWYGRFAKNNQITLAEAKTWLSGGNLEEFKWSVEDFIKYGKEAAVNPALIKQLENASARFHISKLEMLKLQTQTTIEKLYGNTQTATSSLFGKIYKDSYYHTAYELQHGFGIGWDFAAFNESQVENVLSKPWTLDNQTFSDRLWTQKQSLLNEVHTQLIQNMILGKAPDDAIKAIAKKFNTSKQNAGRLVMTESAYFANVAQRNAFIALDVEQYEVIETLDGETCPICGAFDGKVFQMSEYEAGTTAPPFHPWCRGCTAPYFPDDEGERVARDEDGKEYYVPQNITYSEWKETFVDGTKPKTGFKEVTKNGVVHYTPNIPLPSKPAKKEYLTKNKLQGNIMDIDSKVKALDDKYSGDVFGKGTADDIQAYTDFNKQKTELQELLNKKLHAEKLKVLVKQQVDLTTQFDAAQIKTYSGIWKDDVTTLDWSAKQDGVQGKKAYFEQQLKAATLPDEIEKWEKLLADLEEFDTEGSKYNSIKQKLQAIQRELTKPNKSVTIIEDAFSQERKDAALWAKSVKSADNVLRDVCGDVWRNATTDQKNAIYEYTSSYSKFNEPLRGIEYGTNKFLGVGNVDLDEIGINYSGFKRGQVKKLIDDMTDVIDNSSYSKDVWVQRGAGYSGMDKFFEIDISDFNLSESELADKLINTTPTEHAFCSTGVAKGKGFSHHPIIMNIYAPAGTKMMYAEPFSSFGNGSGRSWNGIDKQDLFGSEAEMIFQRGTKFRVTKVEKSEGKIFINLDIIEQRVK